MQIEGTVLKAGTSSVRLQPFAESEPITLRTTLAEVVPVPGEIALVEVSKRWRYRGHTYATGRILASTFDVDRLGLKPLTVYMRGLWSPEPDEPDKPYEFSVSPRVRALLPATPLPDLEMEQVIPGFDLENTFSETDPAILSIEFARQGNMEAAWQILDEALAADLRYLDGHAHMGNLLLRDGRSERNVAAAQRHYGALEF